MATMARDNCPLDGEIEKAPNLAPCRPVFPGKFIETVLKFVIEVISLLSLNAQPLDPGCPLKIVHFVPGLRATRLLTNYRIARCILKKIRSRWFSSESLIIITCQQQPWRQRSSES